MGESVMPNVKIGNKTNKVQRERHHVVSIQFGGSLDKVLYALHLTLWAM
jgi:hypothetical protein